MRMWRKVQRRNDTFSNHFFLNFAEMKKKVDEKGKTHVVSLFFCFSHCHEHEGITKKDKGRGGRETKYEK